MMENCEAALLEVGNKAVHFIKLHRFRWGSTPVGSWYVGFTAQNSTLTYTIAMQRQMLLDAWRPEVLEPTEWIPTLVLCTAAALKSQNAPISSTAVFQFRYTDGKAEDAYKASITAARLEMLSAQVAGKTLHDALVATLCELEDLGHEIEPQP